MILSAITSMPELLEIEKTVPTAANDEKPKVAQSEQILSSTVETPEETLTDKVEISYQARRQSELNQYAEYEMYAQAALINQQKTGEMLAQSEEEQLQNQLIVTFPGVNLLV